MKIMAVDLGDARTGLATCDPSETLASPLTVLHEKDKDKLTEKISMLAKENQIELIVVGYPKHMDNTIGERAVISETFAKELAEFSGLPVRLWDERGTTVTALGYLDETETWGKKRKNVVDAVAATIILENFLHWRKHHPEDGKEENHEV